MRLRNHRGYPFGVDAVVDLYLPEPARRVPADRLYCTGFAIDDETVVRTERRFAFDKSAAHDTRSRDFSILDTPVEDLEHTIGIAHIAHCGDAREQVEQRVIG